MKTGLSGWVLAISRALDAEGVPHQRVFTQIGMDETRLEKGSSRYSQDQLTALWHAAVEETANPYFGLKVAKFIRPATFHVVGYAMSCSATIGDALHRFARYAKLISSSAIVSLGNPLSPKLSMPCWQESFPFAAGLARKKLFPSRCISSTPVPRAATNTQNN